MAITRATASSVIQGLPKSKSTLAGNLPILSGSYESIATVTVGAGGVSSVEFTSIPNTYKHLQVRGIAKMSSNGDIAATVNGDTGSNYNRHYIYGDGSSAGAGYEVTYGLEPAYVGTSATAFGVFVQDFLDYQNTNKNKTTRSLGGVDTNGGGLIIMYSGLWRNTAAITSIKYEAPAATFSQYSQFALYGIKG